MRNALLGTGAMLTFALGLTLSSGASAQMILQEDPNTDQKVVVNLETQQEMPVVAADSGMAGRPADCPEGAFFLGQDPNDDTKEIVTSCDSETTYSIGEVGDFGDAEGTAPAEGYPEGARLLTENENTDQGGVQTGTEANTGSQ